MSDVTQILQAIARGEKRVADELLPLVYGELRRLAAQKLAGEKPGQTLDATSLVHEAYLRLLPHAGAEPHWDSRGHYFAAAAEAMRRILVENARRKKRQKHGGALTRQPLEDDVAAPGPATDLLALDEALTRLAAKDKVKAELVKLRFFAGLTLDQAADVLGISPATADRYWAYARAWLHQDITRSEVEDSSKPAAKK